MSRRENRPNGSNKPNHNNGKPFNKRDGVPAGHKDFCNPMRNDPEYYMPNDQIGKDIASLPFNVIPGSLVPLHATLIAGDGDESLKMELSAKRQPSVLGIGYVPSIGVTNSKTDGINMAAVQLYTRVRKNNSGAKNYEAPDLMMYVLGAASAYATFFKAKRAIGLVDKFEYLNHNLPKTLFAAMNIDYADLKANQANYRGRLNILAEKLNSFAIPKYFKYFLRSAFINSTVFMDSESVKGQYYVFDPKVYYVWNGTKYETGTALEAKYHDPNETLGNVLDHLEEQIDAFFLDEDALTMSGDILKAFSDGEVYRVVPVTDAYKTPVIFDQDVLAQIQNMVMVANNFPWKAELTYNANGSFDIRQRNQLIEWKPELWYSTDGVGKENLFSYVKFHERILNSYKNSPDYKDVIEWTRLMSTQETRVYSSSEEDKTYGVTTITSCGTELITVVNIYKLSDDGSSVIHHPFKQVYYDLAGGNSDEGLRDKDVQIMQFDYHPTIYAFSADDDDSDFKEIYIASDLKNATVISEDQIKLLNDTAMYALFYSSSNTGTNS